jgi:hypothetical protein
MANVKVSDGSQPPEAPTSPLGVPAGARSLDRHGSAISLLNQLSCRQASSQSGGIRIYPVNLQPLNSHNKVPRPLPSKQCLSLANALACCLNDLTVTICQTRQWSVIEENLRCGHRIPIALLPSSHCHLCELRKPSDNQQMFTCDRAHGYSAERKGQRREPSATGGRISMWAERLAPVRCTVWLAIRLVISLAILKRFRFRSHSLRM